MRITLTEKKQKKRKVISILHEQACFFVFVFVFSIENTLFLMKNDNNNINFDSIQLIRFDEKKIMKQHDFWKQKKIKKYLVEKFLDF